MPAVDIGRDEAADAAAHELAKPGYEHPSAWDRLQEWISARLARLELAAAHFPGGWITLIITVILILVAVFFLVRLVRRAARPARELGMFADDSRTADDLRSMAEDCAAQGNWDDAIRHRLRAVARQLEERGLLTPLPGRTAGEMAETGGALFPILAGRLRSGAQLFDGISYGGRHGTAEGYRAIRSLDDALLMSEPAPTDGERSSEWERVA